MNKVDIRLNREKHLMKICHFCEIELFGDYYNLYIEYVRDNLSVGRYRYMCSDCHCALKKIFTGVD